MVIHGDEAGGEDAADILHVFETERCLGKLAICYLTVNHLVNGIPNGLFGEIGEAARTCFDGISHHENRRFFSSRFGSRISENRFIDLLVRMIVTIRIVEITDERGSVMRGDEIDDHFGQMTLTRQLFAFRHMGDDHLCGIARVHFQERILVSGLVLHEIERFGHLTYIMIERARTHEEGIGSDGLRSLRSQVGHLHRMLESAGRFLGERMKQFRVDIRQFHQGDGRYETEDFLKQIYQSVTTDCEKCADGEIKIHLPINRCPFSSLGKRDCGIRNDLRQEYPPGSLEELCAACHVRQRGDSRHTHRYLDEEELHRGRYYDRDDEDGREMEEKSSPRVKEDTRQDRYLGEWNDKDRQIEAQGETSEGNDDKHLQTEEQDGGCRAEELGSEDIEIDDEKREEKEDENRLSCDR